MALDLLNIEPTTISRDLKGKYICIYSQPKAGKTSFAVQCPNNLLLAFEKGYNALGGVKAADITTWSEFKVAIRQLAKPEVKAMYDTITIDTIGIAWELCEKYISAQNNVPTIGDIPWGKGFKLCTQEFSDAIRAITMLGYGLIIIAHSKTRIEKVGDDNTIEIIEPAIPERAHGVVNQLVDIIGYIGIDFDENGNSRRTLYTRRTPTLMAGSRFKHLPAKIPFGYQELTEALVRAIEMSGSEDGAVIVDSSERTGSLIDKRPFEEAQTEARDLWTALVESNPDNANRILNLVENIFGERKKLSEIIASQQDLFELLIVEMRAM